MGIDDSADLLRPVHNQNYRDQVDLRLEKLVEKATKGELGEVDSIGSDPRQIITHFLSGRLQSAMFHLEQNTGTISKDDARYAIRSTYEALKKVHAQNEQFRDAVFDLKSEFEEMYTSDKAVRGQLEEVMFRKKHTTDKKPSAESVIGPLSEFIDDFRETSEE